MDKTRCPSCDCKKDYRGPVFGDEVGSPPTECSDRFHDDPAKPDMVNHPPHYTQGGIECIDAIQAACSPVEFVGFLKGQVLKYTWRLGKKGPFLEDAMKAAWYLDKMLQVTGGGKP